MERDGLDLDAREVHVRQQLTVISGRAPHLAPPKTKASARTNELPAVVADALRSHLTTFPVRAEEIEDETEPRRPTVRPARLIFTRGDLRPIHRADWSHIWRPAVKAAGLPLGFGLRDLRHYFATVLIFGGANVKSVQLAMGHHADDHPQHLRGVLAGRGGPDADGRRLCARLYRRCTGRVRVTCSRWSALVR